MQTIEKFMLSYWEEREQLRKQGDAIYSSLMSQVATSSFIAYRLGKPSKFRILSVEEIGNDNFDVLTLDQEAGQEEEQFKYRLFRAVDGWCIENIWKVEDQGLSEWGACR